MFCGATGDLLASGTASITASLLSLAYTLFSSLLAASAPPVTPSPPRSQVRWQPGHGTGRGDRGRGARGYGESRAKRGAGNRREGRGGGKTGEGAAIVKTGRPSLTSLHPNLTPCGFGKLSSLSTLPPFAPSRCLAVLSCICLVLFPLICRNNVCHTRACFSPYLYLFCCWFLLAALVVDARLCCLVTR